MEKETSCINARAIFGYVKRHNNGDCSGLLGNLHPEIDSLENPEGFLTDPNNWVSCAVISELYRRARSILNDPLAAYKIARYAVQHSDMGWVQRILVKGFWSYKMGLKHVQRINDKWNRSKRVELVDIQLNSAVIRLHWDPHMEVTKDVCLVNQGTYTFLPLVWSGQPLNLKEESCYFEGGPYCEYHLQWPAKNIFYELYTRFFSSKSVLVDTIVEMEEDKKLIEQKYEEINQLNVELRQKVKQLLAIQDTGKAILSLLDLEELLTVIMNLLSNVCRINRAVIMLVNEEEGHLEYLHSVGFEDKIPDQVKDYKVPLNRLSNILARVASTGHPEYVPEVKSSRLKKDNIMIVYGNPSSVYVVPLITRTKVIGVIATDAVEDVGVPKDTREMLEIFAPQIAIAIQNATLYSKLQEQMAELKQSHALLSRSEKFSFLGHLAARLAHEIKNPMTAIGTFIQMMPAKYQDEEFRNDFHKIAMEETNRVNNLITELLDLVKTSESHFELADLHGLIDKMILLVSPQTRAKRIEVTRQFDPDIGQVWMDAEKMKQVVLNLLTNAIDFTPEGGKIALATRRHREKGKPESVHIEVQDNGPGISQSMMDKVFDPYFTTKHKSDIHKGTGLGLFIAHQNMQDHGGTIDVESKANKGTKFVLTLPTDYARDPSQTIDLKKRA